MSARGIARLEEAAGAYAGRRPHPRRVALGIDVGGGTIKAGVVDEGGRVLALARVATPGGAAGADEVVAAMGKAARRASNSSPAVGELVGVAVSTPAFSEGPDWTQRLSSNVPALDNVALPSRLVAAFGPGVLWEYDTNAACYAELRHGRAGRFERVLYVGIGTGISAAMAVRGQLVRHTFETTGNSGHVIVEPDGERCSCGGRGCLETVTSGWALQRAAIAAAESGSSRMLAELLVNRGRLEAADVHAAALAGDAMAGALLARAGRALGVGLASLVHLYVPDAIVVGGGVAGAGELILEPARVALGEVASPVCLGRLQILEQGVVGPDAGVVGLASLVLG